MSQAPDSSRFDRPIVPTPLPSRGEGLISRLLEELGEDPGREGLARTPTRVWESLRFLTDGYGVEPVDVVGDALFAEDYQEMVMVRDVDFYSLCEHHLLPFFGKAHIGYIPDGQIVGLSKIPRLVDVFSHRLQVQERLTNQIADAMAEVLQPRGVGVVLEASHLCMMMRGVQKQNSAAVTAAMRGVFESDPRIREEFLGLVRRS